MKAYQITLLVTDHDGIGAKGIRGALENTKYPNHCIAPTVMASREADIGPWRDAHPLNRTDTQRAEYERLFAADGKVESDAGPVLT